MMNEDEIYDKTIDILAKVFKEIDRNKITPDANLKDDLGLDSVDLMDAIYMVEDEFSIKLMKDGNLTGTWPETVSDMVSIIGQKVKEAVK